MQYPFRVWLFYFLLYCILGWFWECLQMGTVQIGAEKDRFYAPLLSVYGLGAAVIFWLVPSVRESVLLTFFVWHIGINRFRIVELISRKEKTK